MSLSTRKEIAVEPSRGFAALVYGATNAANSTVTTTSSTKKLTTALAQEQSPIEKINIALQKAMTKITYTDLTATAMHYINRETATILTKHPYPIVKEFGKKSLASHKENSAHLDAETGCVKSPVVVLNMMVYSLTGYIYWHKNNSWQWYCVSPPGNYHVGWQQAYGWSTGVAILPTPTTFSLLSPTHIAALIGDIELMKNLEKKGFKIDEFDSPLNVTELELALIGYQPAMFDYLFGKMPKKNSHNALRYAIENNASMAVIYKIISIYTISDECIDMAKKRDAHLGAHLEMRRVEIMRQKLDQGGPCEVMRYLLELPLQSPNSMRKLICSYPQIVSTVKDKKSGNTLLHELIIEKNTDKIKSYLIAIDECAYLQDIPFDVEVKNSDQKSVLQLALEIGVKDIVVAILIYGDPCITACEEKINQANILLAEIQRERNKLMKRATNKMAQMQLNSMGILKETNDNLGDLATQHNQTSARLEQVMTAVGEGRQAVSNTSNHLLITAGNDKPGDLSFVKTEIAELKAAIEALQKRLVDLERHVLNHSTTTNLM